MVRGQQADVIDLDAWRRRRARDTQPVRAPVFWVWTVVWVRLW